MRETRPSGLEGGATRSTCRPYPYQGEVIFPCVERLSYHFRFMGNDFRHEHLRRLDRVWVDTPVWFVTCCLADRRPILASDVAVAILNEVWDNSETLYGWKVGAYVVMPDHVHFFCAGGYSTKPLSTFIGKWKEWTAKYLHRRHQHPAKLWQDRFFDHVLRSEESFTQKWLYVQNNPVRAGLVKDVESWPYCGTRHVL